MSVTVDSAVEMAMELPPQLRELVALRLLDSLDQAEQSDVEAAWDEEIQRRLEAFDKGQLESIPAEEVFARLKRKFPDL